jgi:hypothetical protein
MVYVPVAFLFLQRETVERDVIVEDLYEVAVLTSILTLLGANDFSF